MDIVSLTGRLRGDITKPLNPEAFYGKICERRKYDRARKIVDKLWTDPTIKQTLLLAYSQGVNNFFVVVVRAGKRPWSLINALAAILQEMTNRTPFGL